MWFGVWLTVKGWQEEVFISQLSEHWSCPIDLQEEEEEEEEGEGEEEEEEEEEEGEGEGEEEEGEEGEGEEGGGRRREKEFSESDSDTLSQLLHISQWLQDINLIGHQHCSLTAVTRLSPKVSSVTRLPLFLDVISTL